MKDQSFLTRYQRYLLLLRSRWEEREDIRAYLELLLTLVTIAFFAWFAIKPTLATIATLLQELSGQRNTTEQLSQKLNNLSNLQENQKLAGDIELANQAFPQEAQHEIAARQIETLVAKEGISLVNLSVTQTADKKTGDFDYITMSASVAGEPSRVMLFLEKLGQMRRPATFESLDISGKPPGLATELAANFVINLPYLTSDTKISQKP